MRTYDELIRLKTFDERFEYLKLNGNVAKETFGLDRRVNQNFYHSDLWRKIRRDVIVRDMGCDLGLDGCEIRHGIYIHHMNPIKLKDILDVTDFLTNPQYLICTSLATHNAIHYGTYNPNKTIIRTAGDTCPWKRG